MHLLPGDTALHLQPGEAALHLQPGEAVHLLPVAVRLLLALLPNPLRRAARIRLMIATLRQRAMT